MELKILELQKEGITAPPQHSSNVAPTLPKLPPFTEDDDCDAYLRRFERYASSVGWDKSDWGIALSALLTGRALEVYNRLSETQTKDYFEVKKAILRIYDLSEEGYRIRFRSSKPQMGESHAQFVERIEDYLDRWVEMSGRTPDLAALKELLVMEHIYEVSDHDLGLFLRERKPSSLVALTTLADQYAEAHSIQVHAQDFAQPRDGKHIDKKASQKGKCFECGKFGHYSNNCPLKQQSKVRNNRNTGKSSIADACVAGICPTTTSATDDDGSLSDGENSTVQLPCGHELTIISASCISKPSHMPICEGELNNDTISVLRDTGCSSVIVRKALVRDYEYVGHTQTCALVDGSLRRAPVARIQVKSPYFSGKVNALCFENPPYDLIIGNVPGVQDAGSPLLYD